MSEAKDEREYGFYVRSSGPGARQNFESWRNEEPLTRCEYRKCNRCGKPWMVPVAMFINKHWVKVHGPAVCGPCLQEQANSK